MNILKGLRDTQVPLVEREMATAWDRVRAGGTVHSQITSGHFPTEEPPSTVQASLASWRFCPQRRG
jgi:hypothetical protein